MYTPRTLQLPPTHDTHVNSLRYEVNPAIDLSALTDLYNQVQKYQSELRQLAQRIQRLYAEGPVVSGWLASEANLKEAVQHSGASQDDHGTHSSDVSQAGAAPALSDRSHQPTPSQPDVSLFRHGDTDDLMKYLSALEHSISQTPQSSPSEPSVSSAQKAECPSQYYLCRLGSNGQIRAELCPSNQVPVLSMAIARYHRLNQIAKRKQTIEAKLQAVLQLLGDAQQVLAG